MTVIVTVAVRINDDAASVRRFAFLPIFASYFFAFILDALFCRIVVFVKIPFRTLAFFCSAFIENALSETAFERALFCRLFLNATAVFIFFVTVDAFAVFFTVAVDVAERIFSAFKRAVFIYASRSFADRIGNETIFAVAVDAAALV